jgi:hypothetical protein
MWMGGLAERESQAIETGQGICILGVVKKFKL